MTPKPLLTRIEERKQHREPYTLIADFRPAWIRRMDEGKLQGKSLDQGAWTPSGEKGAA